ncbi:MAG: hypothetical protein P8Z68_01630 [Kineosporiaceae bacterium]
MGKGNRSELFWRADATTFAAWRRTLGGLPLPPGFGPPAEELRDGPPSELPYPLALALSVHGFATTSITVRLDDTERELLVVLSLVPGLGAALTRRAPPGDHAPEEVTAVLFPAREAVDQVLRHLPAPDGGYPGSGGTVPGPDTHLPGPDTHLPGPDAHLPGPDRPVPVGTTLQVSVTTPDDAVWRWYDAWEFRGDGWGRFGVGELAAPCGTGVGIEILRTEVALGLTGVLAGQKTVG